MARSGPFSDEIDRLQRVYDSYDGDPTALRRWSEENPGNRAIHAERDRRVGALLGNRWIEHGGGPVLEVGCGTGQALAALTPHVRAGTVGLDLSEERLRRAATTFPTVPFVRAEASALPFDDATFGVALAFTVFSSILDSGLAVRMATEIGRVLRPGGVVVWYDLRRRNPGNRQVHPLGRRSVAALFPGWRLDLTSVTVAPPVARRLGRFTESAYPRLAALKGLNTHFLGLVTKPA